MKTCKSILGFTTPTIVTTLGFLKKSEKKKAMIVEYGITFLPYLNSPNPRRYS
jgi:hypothetical protein